MIRRLVALGLMLVTVAGCGPTTSSASLPATADPAALRGVIAECLASGARREAVVAMARAHHLPEMSRAERQAALRAPPPGALPFGMEMDIKEQRSWWLTADHRMWLTYVNMTMTAPVTGPGAMRRLRVSQCMVMGDAPNMGAFAEPVIGSQTGDYTLMATGRALTWAWPSTPPGAGPIVSVVLKSEAIGALAAPDGRMRLIQTSQPDPRNFGAIMGREIGTMDAGALQRTLAQAGNVTIMVVLVED